MKDWYEKLMDSKEVRQNKEGGTFIGDEIES